MILSTKEPNAAGRALVGAAAASNRTAMSDEDDERDDERRLTPGYEPGRDEFSARSASGSTFRGPDDVNQIQ